MSSVILRHPSVDVPISVTPDSGSIVNKPVPMKLFATWEVDRTPPNCIPRLCSLTLTRLVLYKSLGPDISSIVIAVKMQSSKRTLRSNEIHLPPSNGLLDTELELTFSLQYPHFLKREGNQLQISLQRRKKYKNRTILGFKTLSVGLINMSQVLQKQLDLELELFPESKDKASPIGKVYMLSLSSSPVDHEDKKNTPESRDIYSDDDEEYSSGEEGSDSEPLLTELVRPSRNFKMGASSSRPRIKQKIISLLKKFKANDEDEEEDGGEERLGASNVVSNSVDRNEFEEYFDQCEDCSESDKELDTISVGSTPKPSLKPFFTSTKNLRSSLVKTSTRNNSDRCSDESSKDGVSDSHPETLTDPEYSDPTPPQSGDEIKRDKNEFRRSRLFRDKHGGGASKNSTTTTTTTMSSASKNEKLLSDRLHSLSLVDQVTSPRKVLLEQLNRLLPIDNDSLPNQILLVNNKERQGAHLAAKCGENGIIKVISTAGPGDIAATLVALVNKIQKFINNQSLSRPPRVKVALVGSHTFINCVLVSYVEVFSSKPPDWQAYVLFYIIPLGINSVAKYIGSQSSEYSKHFLHESWKELLERAEPSKAEVSQMIFRIKSYLDTEECRELSFPIAEAMVTYKEKSSDEESSQVFIPFLSDVRVGVYGLNEGEDEFSDRLTPPHSPHVGSLNPLKERNEVFGPDLPLDLHLDYWLGSSALASTPESIRGGKGGGSFPISRDSDSVKFSMKTSIRFMQVNRLGEESNSFSMLYWPKEKKPKNVIRLGKKKDKDDPRNPNSVDGISRLICLSKNQNPLKVYIDGAEWCGVKFFQLSSQWQTHIKSFPVACFP